MIAGAKQRKDEQGFALVVVLAFLLVFASFLTPFVVASHNRILTTSHSFRKVQLDFAAEAAALVAANAYANWSDEKRVSVVNKTFTCDSKFTKIQFEFLDHRGLIDLNMSDEESIAIGLVSLGLEMSKALKLARSIVEFRTPRRNSRNIEGHMPTSGYKFGYFEAVIELHDFPELHQVKVGDLEEVFSIYKKAKSISLDHASARLKDAFVNNSNASDSLTVNENGASHASIDIYMSNGPRNWVSNRYIISYSSLTRKFVSILSSSTSPHSKKQWEKRLEVAESEICNDVFSNALPVLLEVN